MGMSTHVIGFKPADEKWQKMKAAYEACIDAGIAIPKQVQDFFGYGAPDEAGVEVSADALEKCGALQKWSGDSRSGYELFIDRLPEDVKVVRFYNSW